jgi:glycosyltransferase involved in cell wall biosynthesis
MTESHKSMKTGILKSPENCSQTHRFLRKRLLQARRSAALLNSLAVLHGRLNTPADYTLSWTYPIEEDRLCARSSRRPRARGLFWPSVVRQMDFAIDPGRWTSRILQKVIRPMCTVSLITTCKGRLSHLKLSLPQFVRAGAQEVIVVDYDCPDRCGEYVRANFRSAKVVTHTAKPYFSAAEARNSGAAVAQGEYLFFADADLIVGDDFLEDVRGLHPKWDPLMLFKMPGDRYDDARLTGSCLIASNIFRQVGGYDEAIEGFGHEDTDLYRAVERLNCTIFDLDATGIMTSLTHPDTMRTKYHLVNNRRYSMLLNEFYCDFKQQTIKHMPKKWLDLNFRKELRQHIDNELRLAIGDRKLQFDFNYLVDGMEFRASCRLSEPRLHGIVNELANSEGGDRNSNLKPFRS